MSYYDVDSILTDGEVSTLPPTHTHARTSLLLLPPLPLHQLTFGLPFQKVPCTFELDVPYLGHLDNSSSGLKPGTDITLPLWLAEMLALASSGDDSKAPLTLHMPSCLSESVMAALRADPRSVPLRDQSVHMYGVGVRMLDLFDEAELAAVLRRSFVVRAADVGLHARKADEGIGLGSQQEEFLRGLDEWERGLFRRAHEGIKSAKGWSDKVKKG
ncbi:GINS complex subunit 3 [Geosmithia morbida]|uniref:DNA replication complex GINS protein PSF3 n=1 Tax=Geosmithia morbida TaxID=1094350 RepID=A0A9P4YRW6_9HYPO|nr:GINS complex subunit 3 [Geosmithia morbida]KAF4121988.1 GINS complex subunit 3 [Geosmithia morbida]